MTRLKVGFIGLGDQGGPMAEAISETHDLHVWARRPETLAPFAATAVRRMDSAKSVASSVAILCLCLPGDAELETLLWGDGLMESLASGAVVINHGTGDPQRAVMMSKRLAEAGFRYLDAPVSGGRPGAVARTLTCFVGGDAATVAACTPVIASHSNAIRRMGGPGAGQMTKLLNNALTVANLRNLVEVFGVAAQAGVDLSALQDALSTSSGGSFMAQALGKHVKVTNSAHIAALNRKDVQEFAEAMRRQALDPGAIVDWAMGGPDGLLGLVTKLELSLFGSAKLDPL